MDCANGERSAMQLIRSTWMLVKDTRFHLSQVLRCAGLMLHQLGSDFVFVL